MAKRPGTPDRIDRPPLAPGGRIASRRRFGRLRKLPSGRWQARYPDGSGQDVPAPRTFLTKGDATRCLVMVEADMARGRHVGPSAGRVTLRQWADQWLARPGKRANSVARDRQALAVFTSDLGDRPLASHYRNACAGGG